MGPSTSLPRPLVSLGKAPIQVLAAAESASRPFGRAADPISRTEVRHEPPPIHRTRQRGQSLCRSPLAASRALLRSSGILRVASAADSAHLLSAFGQGLTESGFIEGQNVNIEYRFA